MGEALRSSIIVRLAAVTFLNYFAFYSFTFWFPTMRKRRSGFSDLDVGLFGTLPYIAGFLAMQYNGWHSDRTQERRWHATIPTLIGAAALLGLAARPGSITAMLMLFTLFGYLNKLTGSFSAGLVVTTSAALAAGLLMLSLPRRAGRRDLATPS